MQLDKVISNVVEATTRASDLSGRMPFSIVKGIVTNNNDPENLRRIKATNSIHPNIDTYWLQRLFHTGIDGLMPAIGSTVIVFYEESNPNVGFYIPVQNKVNKPSEKADPINDYHSVIPGVFDAIIDNEATKISVVNNGITIETGTVEVTALTFTINGQLIVNGNATVNGNILVTGDIDINADLIELALTTGLEIDGNVQMTSPFVEIIGATSARINGKQIATVGAIDSRGDALTSKGW